MLFPGHTPGVVFSLYFSLISSIFSLSLSLLVPSLFVTPSGPRSVVTAMVRNNVNTVVDIEKIFVQLNGTQSRLIEDNKVSVWVE